MIRPFFLVVCIVASAVTAHAQLVTPQLSKPASEPVEGDPLHEQYEAAWFRYEKAIGEIQAKVHAAFDAQFDKAADAGNLDLADMWDKKKKAFADTGSVTWPSDGKTKTEWRKKYETTDFPDEFTDVIAAAGAGFEKAVATLKEDYESLVSDYTKDRNLARAKALRDELAGLARKPVAAEERPKMVEKKADPEKELRPEQLMLKKLVGRWSEPSSSLIQVISADGSCRQIRKHDGSLYCPGTLIIRTSGPSFMKLANGWTLEIEPIGSDGTQLASRAFDPKGNPRAPGVLQRVP